MDWIKLRSDFLDWKWFNKPEMVQLFIYLLLSAKSEDSEGLQRGQIGVSASQIANDTSLSRQTIRTCLSRLQSTNRITIKTTNKNMVITITDCDSYQRKNKSSNQQINHQINQQPTNTLTSKSTNKLTNKIEGLSTSFSDGYKGVNFSTNQQTNQQINQQTNQREEKEKRSKKEKELLLEKKKDISKDISQKEKSFSFCATDFIPIMEEWLTYKKERRESYKSERSIKTCYNNLFNLSGGNPDVARAIINQSIANNWAGLFKLKDVKITTEQPKSKLQREMEYLQSKGVSPSNIAF